MSSDFDDDAALDELEDRLKGAPVTPYDPPVLSQPFRMRRIVRQMARAKRWTANEEQPLRMRCSVALHQTVHQPGRGGWFTFSSTVTEETVAQVQAILDEYFGKKKLEVKDLRVVCSAFGNGVNGAYIYLLAQFNVV